ncbi:MAG: hypothetical protein ACK5KT_15520 [Dysgonomonas sp.]
MKETLKNFEVKPNDKKLVDTSELQFLVCSGRKTAVDIGIAAGARVQIGRRVLWNVSKVQKYLDAISE